MNESVVWFDWADGQPNNFHGQNCITLRETHVPILPQFRDYYWNDYECDGSAHYICEHRLNESVVWFDWADGQPNNFHGQNCITLRETHVPILPQFRDYYWNDYECDGSAHYICEHRCFDQNGNRSP